MRRWSRAPLRAYAMAIVFAATLAAYVALATAVARAPDVARIGFVPGPDAAVLSVLGVFAGVGCLLLGSLVVVRRPKHRVGWALLAIGVGWVMIEGCSYLAYTRVPHHEIIGEVALVAWSPLVALVGGGVVFLLALFPSGTVAAGWRPWALGVLGSAMLCDIVACLIQPRLKPSGSTWFTNPIRVQGITSLVSTVTRVAPLVMAFIAVVMALDLVWRWWRSVDIERLQMKFLGCAVVVAAPLLVVLAELVPATNGWEAWFFTVLNAFAIAIGLAIIRVRLYDIDRLLSRTLAYVLVTGSIVAAYVGVITLATKALGFSSSIAVATSTLIAAALFNPFRRRVQTVVDRRFNRARYDAENTVAVFAAHLRDAVDIGRVQEELVEVVNRTLEPESVGTWLAVRDAEVPSH